MTEVLNRICQTLLKPRAFLLESTHGGLYQVVNKSSSCEKEETEAKIEKVNDGVPAYDIHKCIVQQPVYPLKISRLSSKVDSLSMYLTLMLPVSKACVIQEYYKHRCLHQVSVKKITETVEYLLERGFDRDTIAESVSICFYTKDKVEYGLQQVENNEEELRSCGIVDGFIAQEANHFRVSKKCLDKRLELCIYYIEKGNYYPQIKMSNFNDY